MCPYSSSAALAVSSSGFHSWKLPYAFRFKYLRNLENVSFAPCTRMLSLTYSFMVQTLNWLRACSMPMMSTHRKLAGVPWAPKA